MHEWGIVVEIQKRVQKISKEKELAPSDIAEVLLEGGEAYTIVPRYLQECWPAAVDETGMEKTKLEVEIITAVVECKQCGTQYEYLNNDKKCPNCSSIACVMGCGQEFCIKQISIFEETADSEIMK